MSFLTIPAAVCGLLDTIQDVYSIMNSVDHDKDEQTGSDLVNSRGLGKIIFNLRSLFASITPLQKRRLELIPLENLMVVITDLVLDFAILDAGLSKRIFVNAPKSQRHWLNTNKIAVAGILEHVAQSGSALSLLLAAARASTEHQALQYVNAFDDLVDKILEEDEALAKRFNRHSAFREDAACTPLVEPFETGTNGIQWRGSKMRYNSWVLLMIGDLSLFWSAALPIDEEEIGNSQRYMKYAGKNLPPLSPISTEIEAITTTPKASRATSYITPISLLYQPIVRPCKPPFVKDVSKRIQAEFGMFLHSSPWGIVAGIVNDDPLHWSVTMRGPRGSLYEGGQFQLAVRFSSHYPYRSPDIRFITRLWHPNIGLDGRIGVDLLLGSWSPVWTIVQILIAIQSILADPLLDCVGSMNPDAKDLYITDMTAYEQRARKWTQLYAMGKLK